MVNETKLNPPKFRRDIAILLFATLFGSYAYFWQSRDWNAASRLMLTYALVDRRQVAIDGLEGQAGSGSLNPASGRVEMTAGDLARVGSHYYTDKAPGQSLLGAVVYAGVKAIARLPDHPVNELEARAYWLADYLVTLGTSGLLTSLLGVMIYAFSLRLGASGLSAVVLALAYGLGTPALVYGTLFYGHQTSAFCLFTSFFLLYRAVQEGRGDLRSMVLSGWLAGYSVVVEYQTAVIGAMLGIYACASIRKWRPILLFALAGMSAGLFLAAYNYIAFGDPFDFGYAHEVSREFRQIHSAGNPLGVRVPSWRMVAGVLPQIVWAPYRGLLFYAPVLMAAPVGFGLLLWRRHYGVALICLGAILWMFWVNLSYPLWQGGWCTGPRLVVPSIPFAVLLVAGLTIGHRRQEVVWCIAAGAALGMGLNMACVAVGGRFPPQVPNPVAQIVVPHWRGSVMFTAVAPGNVPRPPWSGICPLCGEHPAGYIAGGHQFERNAGRLLGRWMNRSEALGEPSPWQAIQMAPLALFVLGMTAMLLRRSRRSPITS